MPAKNSTVNDTSLVVLLRHCCFYLCCHDNVSVFMTMSVLSCQLQCCHENVSAVMTMFYCVVMTLSVLP